jgi:DNA-binding Xre family transcriptional regulator
MNYKEIFEIIEVKRKEKSLSIASVCRKADLSQTSWANIKHAKKGKGYNLETLEAVCEVLEIQEVLLKL